MDMTIQLSLEKSFEQNSNKTAIISNEIISYEKLDMMSNYLAEKLMSFTPLHTLVALYFNERINYIIGALAALKSRNVFVSIDVSLPKSRIESIFKEYDIEVIITDNIANPIEFKDVHHIYYNNEQSSYYPMKELSYNSEDPVYVYFTSGTTSTPKAILGKNSSLAHFINWEISAFRIDSTYKISQLISPSFDPFLRDIFVPLCAGGTICIPPKLHLLNLNKLGDWLENENIVLIHSTPSIFSILSESLISHNRSVSALKYVLLSGEKINVEMLKKWKKNYGNSVTFVNLYGPTETTMAKSYHIVNDSDIKLGEIPIGKPIPDTKIRILNEHGQECINGDVGMIYISTPYMTHGYFLNEELNKERFVKNPANRNETIYKTGDFGYIKNGLLYYKGRKDRQIKLSGIRIEIDEIESVFKEKFKVSGCAVIYDPKIKSIVLFYCSNVRLEPHQIKIELRKSLPLASIPQVILMIEKIPLNNNGKIDYNSLFNYERKR